MNTINTNENTNITTVVLYHDNCLDGFGAACIVKLKYPDAILVPVQYGKTFEMVVISESAKLLAKQPINLYIVDFCPTLEEMKKVIEFLKPVISATIYDHHKGALDIMNSISTWLMEEGSTDHDISYSEDKSGVGITWDMLFPDLQLPRVLAHIQDRDLWKFELANTKEICHALANYIGRSYLVWQTYTKYDDHVAYIELVNLGRLTYNTYQKECNEFAKNGRLVKEALLLNDTYPRLQDVVFINAPYSHASEVGMIAAKEYHCMACVWQVTGAEIKLSFRSSKEHGNQNCISAAKLFGGGGHHNAAGVIIKVGTAKWQEFIGVVLL